MARLAAVLFAVTVAEPISYPALNVTFDVTPLVATAVPGTTQPVEASAPGATCEYVSGAVCVQLMPQLDACRFPSELTRDAFSVTEFLR